MKKTISMIFAGGRVPQLSVLTERRAKAAVVFGGKYRTIDFALTNLASAGIGRVGILVQYRPSSLVEHVDIGLPWDLTGSDRGVRFLSPYIGTGKEEWYRGPADALYQNIDFIERNSPEDVLVVSGDHVYQMDYQPLISFHHERNADFTMAFTPVEHPSSRFGIGELNAIGRLVNFTEKPELPRTNLANMGVYLFKRRVLVDELLNAVSEASRSRTFHIHEVIRRMIPRRVSYAWVFHGPWYYAQTIDEYAAFHQGLLGAEPAVEIAGWKVHTNQLPRYAFPSAPARILPGATVENSLICEGCIIAGTVRNSVLSPGVRVDKNAVVNESVLWHDVVVEEGAVLDKVISDKRTLFASRCRVGTGRNVVSKELPESLTCGSVVVGMDICVPTEARIGRNCIVHPGVKTKALMKPLVSGDSMGVHARDRGKKR
jgi:glucose-1-phosphate adenylyltransferase